MDSPTFQQRISEILGVPAENGAWRMTITAETTADLKRLLPRIRQQQKELRQLKAEITTDIRNIRAQFDAKASTIQPSVMSLFGGKGLFKQKAAAERRNVKASRDRATAQMESMKTTIDDLMIRLDRAKLDIGDEISRREEK